MQAREAAVTNAADSIVEYHQHMAARDAGRLDEAATLLAEIADYNRDDCVSTWMLRDWLIEQGAAHGTVDGRQGDALVAVEPAAQTPSEQRLALMNLEALLRDRLVGVKPHERSPDEQAVALVAASVLFHAREDKPVWQAHFERLRLPVGDWRSADGVFVVESAEVVEPWHRDTPRQRPRRTLRLHGEPMRSIPAGPGDEVSAVYPDPPPPGVTTLPGHANARSSATVAIHEATDSLAPNGRLHQTLLVEELQPKDGGEHTALPVALVPSKVLSTRPIDDALAEVAQRVLDSADDLPRTAGIDLLARRLPRLRDGSPLPESASGRRGTSTPSSPPCSRPTTPTSPSRAHPARARPTSARASIARLVLEHGWRVGVTSQGARGRSRTCSTCGRRRGRAARARSARRPTTPRRRRGSPSPGPTTSPSSPPGTCAPDVATSSAAPRGTSPARGASAAAARPLVVDEAGQFSLAPRPSPARWPATGCSSSATPSSCHR